MSKELIVVSKSKRLVSIIYKICKVIPEERYVLTPQLLRSAISVHSNIVEGQQRGYKDFAKFLKIAKGSLAEVEVQLDIAYEQYGFRFRDTYTEVKSLIEEIHKMLYSLILKLKADSSD